MIKLRIVQFNGMGEILKTEPYHFVYLPKGVDNIVSAKDFMACGEMFTRVNLSWHETIHVFREDWLDLIYRERL
jgi:hypothetical protein